MDEWTPILVLPNLDVQATIECEFAAIVSPADPRVEQLRKDHPTLTKFLGKFSGQFREQMLARVAHSAFRHARYLPHS
jgi:hypothetical protein